MGLTIITMPPVFKDVERSGRKMEDYCELIDLDPQWRRLRGRHQDRPPEGRGGHEPRTRAQFQERERVEATPTSSRPPDACSD